MHLCDVGAVMVDNEEIKKICVRKQALILDCITIINNENSQMLLVVDDNDAIIGVVSDGDLRRKYIAERIDPMQPIERIMSKKPTYIYEDEGSKEKALELMRVKKISFVPVVDSSKVPCCVFTWKDAIGAFEESDFKVDIPIVIMAGGKGVRLKPYTDVLPKPLIPIGDKTMIEKVMDSFKRHGARRFYISLNYKKELIKAYFDTISKDCEIRYIEEEKYLGTCGALSLLEDVNETFILSNCDTLFEIDMADLIYKHQCEKNKITAVVCEKTETLPYGIFEFDDNGNVCGFSEKPSSNHIINVGLYVIEPEIKNKLKKNTIFGMNDLIAECLRCKDKVGVYSIKEDCWKDLGQMGAIYMMMGG